MFVSNVRTRWGRGQASRSSRPGFTLIEIMVVLALTLVMMSMFATIFSMTGTFVTKQKAVGENDQSARILTTVLKTDLQGRTMRFVAPFHPDMPTAALNLLDPTKRQGYFYVSENDPTDDTDDVLQFTTSLNGNFLPSTNPASGGQFYGAALDLAVPWQGGTNYLANVVVRPSAAAKNVNGFVFKNKTGGPFNSAPAGSEPNWGNITQPGQTITDGTGTWTALASPVDQPDGDDGVIFFNPSNWQATTAYLAGNCIVAVPPNGHSYACTTAGTSGPTQPVWPLTAGATVTDGTVTWTTDAVGQRTLDPINGNPNNTGASQYAEVTYFLRHGNLYRRVLLIRSPYDATGQATGQPFDTDLPTPALLIPGLYPPYPLYPPNLANSPSGNFWTDFDYAARIQPPAGGTAPTGVQFLSFGQTEDSLNNTNGAGGIPIGRPDNRFGFDQTYNTVSPGPLANGAPREFAFQYNSTTNLLNGATPQFFFGRYTQEETSNAIFQFPGNLAVVNGANVSPMGSASLLGLDSNNYTMWLLDANPPTAGLVKSLRGGLRRGEDILLTNVVSFDVKLWDPHYSETAGNDVNRNGVIDSGPAFADVGHTASTGDFHQNKNILPVYGPRVDAGYTLAGLPANTWAPAFTRPVFNGFTYNWNNVFDTWHPQFNFDNLPRTYGTAPPSVNAPAPYRPRAGNTWTAGATYAVGALVDPADTANGYVYQCTAVTPPGTAGPTELFTLADQVGTTITDNNVTWTVMPPLAVQAIQITVKYLDPSQNIMRQVTIVQSLTP